MIAMHLLNLLGEMQAGIEALREEVRRLTAENELQRADVERLTGEVTLAKARDLVNGEEPATADSAASGDADG